MSRFAVLLLIAILISPPLAAQEVSAGITGAITDPSGAAVPGAGVTARDMDRGTTWKTTTNAEGVYAFPRIPAGKYELKFEASGFRTASRRDIVLELNARIRLDLAMELGAVTETVEVAGSAIMLQTESTQVGNVMTAGTNVNLPLNGRNFVQLTLLSAGATTVNPAGFTSGMRTNAGGRPYVNGNREEANNFLLDGIDNNNANSNMVTYQPNVDAIQEFKMITNNASAEFGNFQGGIINITIKSGTNQFHGSLFEFLRNDHLNANAWARNWRGDRKAAIRHNVYGGTIGGPVIRDKLFFFADYQGVRRANPGAPAGYTVIPTEFRGGDLSRLLSERATQLYDPLTTTPAADRQPFANNRIPASRIDAPARNLFNMPDIYPVPMNGDLRFNSLNKNSTYVTTDQGDLKIDAKLTNRDDFSARWSISRLDNPGRNTVPAALGTFFASPFDAGVLNWTRTISPSLVNEFRFGVNRSVFGDGGDDAGVGNLGEKLGIPGANDRGPGLIALNFVGGLSNSIGNQNVGGLRYNVNNTFHYADNLTFIRGRHMMKTGAQLLRQQANVFYAGNNGRIGFMRFTGQYTAGPNANRTVSKGLAEADFILGYPTSLGRGIASGLWGQRKNVIGAYFQDDWRVTNELTLNLGIRWEYNSPFIEVADRQSNFEFYTGKFLQAGKDGVERTLYSRYLRAWQPRLGFAWTPAFLGGKTVLRGAYTISSYLEGMGVGERLTLNPPYATEYTAIYDGNIYVGSTLSQGFTVLQPTDLFTGASIKMWDPQFRPSDVQQWSFILERQLPMDTLVTIGYVGQHGTHLCGRPYYGQKVLLPDGKTANSIFISGNPDLLRAGNVRGTSADYNQRYDSLQATVRKRFSQGLEYQAAYTWSKGMSDSIGFYGEAGQAAAQNAHSQNVYDRKSEWGPTYFDATHIFTFHGAYDVPFGRGMAFGSDWHPVLNAVAGNWRISGMLTLRSGFPLTITALDRSGTVSGGPRADRAGDGEGTRKAGPGASWFDKSAFRQPVAGTFGNSGVGVVRGPGLRNLDVSLQKSFPVAESKRLEFRAEFFNFTNTPIFNAPDRAVNSATFGEISAAQGERNIQLALKFYF
jgi:hypothetical protein